MKRTILFLLFLLPSVLFAQSTVLRVNAGGPAVTNGSDSWSADQGFTGGSSYSTTQAIGNTTQDNVYQTERYGNFSYRIPATSGKYRINLHFAEIFHTVTNARLFNVSVEGGQFTRSNIDLVALYGAFNAGTIVADNIQVTDGFIDVTFTTVKDNAKISAITVDKYSDAPVALKINYSIVNGAFKIAGVDGTNPVIYDNDIFLDTPEGYLVWLKANRKEVSLVGNIATRDMYLPPNLQVPFDQTWSQWQTAFTKANEAGLKNIPAPVRGAADYLRRPADGNIDATAFVESDGSRLIVQGANKASAAKPLVIFVGGNVTTVVNAYLKDKTIADKIIVFHVDGYGQTGYNAVDTWAAEIAVKRLKYINWDGELNSWYDPYRPINISITGLPNNAFANAYRDGFYNQSWLNWKDVADAPPVLWFFDNSLWKNVARKNLLNQTITADNFDFLLVSQNDWSRYGDAVNSVMLNAQNYVPVGTTPPPTEPPPTDPTNLERRYSPYSYGAKGDGLNDDSNAFQAAIDAAIANKGTLVIPPALAHYRITKQLNISPVSQAWMDIDAKGKSGEIKYFGPSNSAVFKIYGLKGSLWEGLNVSIENGRTNVAAFDVTADLARESSSFNTFTTFYVNLGNGEDNIGIRTGYQNVGPKDISNYTFKDIAVFGGGTFINNVVSTIPGQYAFQNLGDNTLSMTWIGGFVANCDRAYSNISRDGQTRGNGSVAFYGLGCAKNNLDFYFAWEQAYLVSGGRFENGNQFMRIQNGGYAAVTIEGIAIHDYKKDNQIEVLSAASLKLENVQIAWTDENKFYNNCISLASSSDGVGRGGAGSLIIDGGGMTANNLYTKTGNTTWEINTRGVAKMNGVWSRTNSFFPNESVRK